MHFIFIQIGRRVNVADADDLVIRHNGKPQAHHLVFFSKGIGHVNPIARVCGTDLNESVIPVL